MNNGINLLGKKNQAPISPGLRKLITLRLIAVWSLFGIAGFSIILFLLISLSPLPALIQQEKTALFTMSAHHQDVAKLLFVQDRLKTSSQILVKRPSFYEKLRAVQERMPNEVTITELSIDTEVIVVTVSSPSLPFLDTFTNNLLEAAANKEDFSEVVMTKLFTNEQTNTFTMTVSLTTL